MSNTNGTQRLIDSARLRAEQLRMDIDTLKRFGLGGWRITQAEIEYLEEYIRRLEDERSQEST